MVKTNSLMFAEKLICAGRGHDKSGAYLYDTEERIGNLSLVLLSSVLLRHKHYNLLNKLIFFKVEVLKLMNQFNDIKIL